MGMRALRHVVDVYRLQEMCSKSSESDENNLAMIPAPMNEINARLADLQSPQVTSGK